MKKLAFILSIMLIVLYSCEPSDSPLNAGSNTEILEIYDVKGDSTSYAKGKLQHYQSEYSIGNKHTETIYYHSDESVKGKEIFLYADSGYPIASEYYSPDGDLLSYYKFIYNKAGKKLLSMGFDSANDELLRIETFIYDKNGNMLTKEIRNDKMKIDRVYYFNYDEHGNQVGMNVLNQDEKVIISEFFRITKYDDENRWKEKWGFVNKVPSTYHIRK